MLQALVHLLATLISTAVMAASAVLGADAIPPALAAMADTERAFARRAADTNFRDAFLEYFADESVGFNPEPGPGREQVRKLPPPPQDLKLWWEPRVGDIASSGDLGYLTGPTETTVAGKPTRHGNYFSVWKKQPDGTYRVILDVGIGVPGAPAFAQGFVRARAVAAYTGHDTKAAAEESLLAADRAFGAALAGRGPAAAYAEALHAAARVHRGGLQPLTTRDAAVEWTRANVTAMTSSPTKGETALSRDLGYTWGAFTATSTAGAASQGSYVRVWTRDASGRWHVAADITQPRP